MNCYLVKTDAGYVLIDTGFHSNRTGLVQELERAGCEPGKLLLIVITHGDLDHIGNCAYLRKRYGAKITIHCGETEAVERGDMALNRKNRPGLIAGIFLSLVSLLSRSDRFKPDVYVADGDDLSRYGFDARVIHFPGHSKGSIGVLTASGNLFCGDLILNIDRPSPSASVDDPADLNSSIEKLKSLNAHTIYPGHGQPFSMAEFLQAHGRGK